MAQALTGPLQTAPAGRGGNLLLGSGEEGQ